MDGEAEVAFWERGGVGVSRMACRVAGRNLSPIVLPSNRPATIPPHRLRESAV